jgi:hypothetical protein
MTINPYSYFISAFIFISNRTPLSDTSPLNHQHTLVRSNISNDRTTGLAVQNLES